MRNRSRLGGLVAALAVVVAPVSTVPSSSEAAVHTATVAPSDDDMAQAKEKYERAKARFDEGEFSAAGALFVDAYDLSGRANLLYNASYAFERAGDYDKAIRYLERYSELAPAGERDDVTRELEQLRERKAASERGAQLETAKIDEPVPAVAVRPADESPADSGPAEPPKRIYGPAAIALTATTVIGAGMALGFGMAALNKRNSIDADCVDGGPDGRLCPSGVEQDERQRRTYAALSDTGIAIGAVSLVALTTVLVVNRRRTRNETAVRVSPSVSASAATVSFSGRF